ncbi:MAG: hypothetical protein FJW95_14955 [Actinobacteria bacterium]|nr:hypothetical protein [Actinomycetota bacterium]
MRIIICTDANNQAVATLVRRTLALVDERPGLEVVGFMTTRPHAFTSTRVREARRWARRVAVAAVDPSTRAVWSALTRRTRIDLFGLARARRVPVLVPPTGDPSDPDFVTTLVERLGPDVALSYYCGRIWRASLLDALPQAVNYHDGTVPEYRGVGATSFSIYDGAPESGFTFHRMTIGIDEGPVLVAGAVPVGDQALAAIDRRKVEAAADALPRVLDRIVTADPGTPQVGSGGYHSARDVLACIHVTHPDAVSAEELGRRVRAFGTVHLTIDGERWPVTRVREGRHGPLAFRVADGRWMSADRVRGLPPRFGGPPFAA